MGKVNLNVTQINAGSAHNVIPDRCDFVLEIWRSSVIRGTGEYKLKKAESWTVNNVLAPALPVNEMSLEK